MRRLVAGLLLIVAAPAVAQHVDVTMSAQADGSRTLVHEIVVPAPIDAVWAAVATVAGWRTWAVPMAREVAGTPDRWETGYDPAVLPGAPSTIEQQWIERVAPRSAAFRTTRTPAGFPHADAYRRVVSRFTLTRLADDSTRVRLEGRGYPAGAAGDALIAFFREGNSVTLRQLHTRFSTGPIDWTAPRATSEER